jgi:hypothetical protein
MTKQEQRAIDLMLDSEEAMSEPTSIKEFLDRLQLAQEMRSTAIVIGQAALDEGTSTAVADLLSRGADALSAYEARGKEIEALRADRDALQLEKDIGLTSRFDGNCEIASLKAENERLTRELQAAERGRRADDDSEHRQWTR